MRRIYIAGPYSANNIITALDNIREGMRAATEVFLAGYAPFCPWHDMHYNFMLRPGEAISLQAYYDYSLAWLEVSDAMLVIGDYQKSKGTMNEISVALVEQIPVFYSLDELMKAMPIKTDTMRW
jgi:nucleoside 2-deoxyribosyltransferase